eukprot:gene57234-biopygen76987
MAAFGIRNAHPATGADNFELFCVKNPRLRGVGFSYLEETSKDRCERREGQGESLGRSCRRTGAENTWKQFKKTLKDSATYWADCVKDTDCQSSDTDEECCWKEKFNDVYAYAQSTNTCWNVVKACYTTELNKCQDAVLDDMGISDGWEALEQFTHALKEKDMSTVLKVAMTNVPGTEIACCSSCPECCEFGQRQLRIDSQHSIMERLVPCPVGLEVGTGYVTALGW